MTDTIRFYRTGDTYGFLSNFWVGSPILLHGHVFKTSEHLYQALKFSGNPDTFIEIRDAKSAKEAARLGRSSPSPRADWDEVRNFAMRLALLLKFEAVEPRTLLLDTKDAPLVEDTTTSGDAYWGETAPGVGQNTLGKLLVEVRAFYRDVWDAPAHEELDAISTLQSEIMARLRTTQYKIVIP